MQFCIIRGIQQLSLDQDLDWQENGRLYFREKSSKPFRCRDRFCESLPNVIGSENSVANIIELFTDMQISQISSSVGIFKKFGVLVSKGTYNPRISGRHILGTVL